MTYALSDLVDLLLSSSPLVVSYSCLPRVVPVMLVVCHQSISTLAIRQGGAPTTMRLHLHLSSSGLRLCKLVAVTLDFFNSSSTLFPNPRSDILASFWCEFGPRSLADTWCVVLVLHVPLRYVAEKEKTSRSAVPMDDDDVVYTRTINDDLIPMGLSPMTSRCR